MRLLVLACWYLLLYKSVHIVWLSPHHRQVEDIRYVTNDPSVIGNRNGMANGGLQNNVSHNLNRGPLTGTDIVIEEEEDLRDGSTSVNSLFYTEFVLEGQETVSFRAVLRNQISFYFHRFFYRVWIVIIFMLSFDCFLKDMTFFRYSLNIF